MSGALLHFLMEFGLSAEQKNEAQAQLRQGSSRRVSGVALADVTSAQPFGYAGRRNCGRRAPVEAPAGDAGAAFVSNHLRNFERQDAHASSVM